MNIFELKQQHKAALDKAEAVLGTPNHVMTAAENEQYNAAMAEATNISNTIRARERQSTIRGMFPNGAPGIVAPMGGTIDTPMGYMNTLALPPSSAATRTPGYATALMSYMRTGGKAHGEELTIGADGQGGYYLPGSEQFTRQRKANGTFYGPQVNAALYEGVEGGAGTTGGDAVNVPTLEMIVPLALPDIGLYEASLVIPTATDVKIPQQASFGTSTIKAESTGTIATFGGTDPTLGQIHLDAFMAGAVRFASFELLQDVQQFQQFIVDDLLAGQRILEDSLYANGTGTGQPQGLFGNTGNGVGTAYALTGTASTDSPVILDALDDVMATLKARYQPNASWIMSRATGLRIRKAQRQSNLFQPVVTFDADGTERIHGKPVFYDINAPALPTATTTGVPSVLYGDFKQAYIIGVRGGAGINVKILDQPYAVNGQVALLCYRRSDGRVRRSEAAQSVVFSHA